MTVVITSGSGGTGLAAIQLAKALGASRIITASSPSKFALLRSLGATDVIDYHAGTIWEAVSENSVDLVYDNFGKNGTADSAMRALRTHGFFIVLGGTGADPDMDGQFSRHPKEGVKQINFYVDSSHYRDLDALSALIDRGHLNATLQQSFGLAGVVDAMTLSQAGHVTGKISIDVTESLGSIVL